jgi:tetratricopeptide (TPR) repeat protein
MDQPYTEFLSAHAREKNRKLAESLNRQGLEAEENDDSDKALALYGQALKANPECLPALVNMGSMHLKMHDRKSAAAYYRKAIEINPDYYLAHYNLALCLDVQGAKNDAIKHYERSLLLKPDYADAHINLAILHDEAGDFRKAIRHYHLYLKHSVGDTRDWLSKARLRIDKLSKKELCVVASSGLAPQFKLRSQNPARPKLVLVPKPDR